MDILLLIATTVLGIYVARTVALQKGLNPGPYVAGALFLSIVAVPWVVAAKPNSERRQERIWTPRVLTATLAYAALIVSALSFGAVSIAREVHTETLNSILAGDAKTSNLKVNYLNKPLSAGIPLIGASNYVGHFTIVHKDGTAAQGNCQFETFDYSGRKIQDESFYLSIEGPAMLRLALCN